MVNFRYAEVVVGDGEAVNSVTSQLLSRYGYTVQTVGPAKYRAFPSQSVLVRSGDSYRAVARGPASLRPALAQLHDLESRVEG